MDSSPRHRQFLIQYSEEGIRRKRTELWREGNWMLYYDNAPYQRALVTHEFLGRYSMMTLTHPQLKGRRFDRRKNPIRIAEGA